MKLTHTNLIKLYVNRKLSSRECAEVLEMSQSGVMSALKRFSIKTRSYKENKMPVLKGTHLSKSHRESISKSMTNNPNNYMNGRIGKIHHQWKDGRHTYRKVAFKELPMKCVGCNKRESEVKRLLVHHKNKNRHDNRISNLMILCDSCHRILHNLEKVK